MVFMNVSIQTILHICRSSQADIVRAVGISGDNSTTQPLIVMAHDSDSVMSASDSAKSYDDTTKQLQFLLVRGPSQTSVPLCVKVASTKSSAASGLQPGNIAWVAVVLGAVVTIGMA